MVPLLAGRFDRSQVTDEVNKKVSDAMVASIASAVANLGTPAWSYHGKDDGPAGPTYVYLLTYPTAGLKLSIRVDPTTQKFSFVGLKPQ